MQWRFIITLWNSLPVCFDTHCHRSHALSHSVDLCWGCSWAELRLELGSGPRKPSSTPPSALRKPPGNVCCCQREQARRKRESRGGWGGGKKGGKSREGWGQESIGRITETQWNIPNYVSAGQIPPCGHIVMRESETSEGMRGPLSVWQNVWGPLAPLSLSSVLCILGWTLEYNCFLPIFPFCLL